MNASQEVSDLVSRLVAACGHKEVEVEARVRKQLVDETSVSRLLQDKRFNWKQDAYTDRKRSSKSNRKCTYRQRRFDRAKNEEVICKSSLMKLDVNDKWCSIYVSTEKSIPSMSQSLEDLETVSVIRHRGITGTNQLMPGLCPEARKGGTNRFFVDVTSSRVEGKTQDAVVRVEIEAYDARHFDYDGMISVVTEVCHVLQDSPCFLGYYDWKVATHVLRAEYGPFCIDKGRYQKPNTMTFRDLSDIRTDTSDWAVTPKVDGVRRFLMIINSRVFDADMAGNIRLLRTPFCSAGGEDVTIVDTEFLDGAYYAFDLAVYDGAYCGNVHDRLELLESLVSALPDVQSKPYERFDSFDGLVRLYERFRAGYASDGLIFAKVSASYMMPVFKWKEFPTVDLRIRGEEVVTSDDVVVDLPWQRPENARDSDIWEFSYAPSGTLAPVKPRPDKLAANSIKVVKKTLTSAVPGSLLTGVGCYLMRKYHNRVKADAIRKANDDGATFFDVGTGQGGDLTKWRRASWVYCVEPSVESTEEMLSRLSSDLALRDRISVFNVPLRDFDIRIISDKIDIFTAFFCVNLFRHDDWNVLKKVVKEKGSKKCRLLMIALTDPRTHDDGCFTLKIKGPVSANEGTRYDMTIHETRISDVAETAVDPTRLKALMSECRMEMVLQQRLNEDAFMTPGERTLSSMYTMFVFKRK